MTNYGDGKYGPIKNWSRGCFMTHGGMGEIFIGKNIDNGQLFLIKSVSRQSIWSKQLVAIQNEEKILRKLSKKKCPNIFRTVGNATSESVAEIGNKPTMDLFLEFAMPRGNLSEIIKRSGKLNESVAKAYTFQILQALSCMHRNGVVHSDIRGVNIIVCERGVKLAGFGLARNLSQRLTKQCSWSEREKQQKKFIEKKAILSHPPECQEDISALGMVVCEMVTGSRPQLDASLPLERAIQSLEEDFVKKNMFNCINFIESCLLPKNIFEAKTLGAGSWTADGLLSHPWIASMERFSPSDMSSDDEAVKSSVKYPDTPPLLFMDANTPRATSFKKCADILCCRRMDTDNVVPPLSSRSLSGDHRTSSKGRKLSRVLSLPQ